MNSMDPIRCFQEAMTGDKVRVSVFLLFLGPWPIVSPIGLSSWACHPGLSYIGTSNFSQTRSYEQLETCW